MPLEREDVGKRSEKSHPTHSNPLKRALLPLTAKHFDTSLLKITGKKRLEQSDFKGLQEEREICTYFITLFCMRKWSILEVMKVVRKSEIAQSNYRWQTLKSLSFSM